MKPTQLLPDLFLFSDTCNVYVIRDGDEAIAIDFGGGKWLASLKSLGIRKLAHVYLTHSHPDQCAGLLKRKAWPFEIHAPSGDQRFLLPAEVAAYWKARRRMEAFPPAYSVLPRGLTCEVKFDLGGFTDQFWRSRRIRFLSTPGHGATAISVLFTIGDREVLLCGDAAHAGATIHEPYELEWDHWTGGGALAAWEGIQRIAALRIDLLCPSHGPVIREKPRAMLHRVAKKLLSFHDVKGHICPGERDDYVEPTFMKCGARRLSPHLVQYSTNSYVLLSSAGEALIVDPPEPVELTKAVLAELGRPSVTALTATHYHCDHSEGLMPTKRAVGGKVYLHPTILPPLRQLRSGNFPFQPAASVKADQLWPNRGEWKWNEFSFRVAPFPGQTRWHCVFMAEIDGSRVMFSGDSFQPASRWNATGGFCAFNGARFDTFASSARLVLDWKPDVLVSGHGTHFRFHASQFQKIIRWAKRAEKATRALCPSGDLNRDYELHPS